MDKTTVKTFLSNGVNGIEPEDNYNTNTNNIDPYKENEEIVGTIRIIGGIATRIKIYHKQDKNNLEQETPPRNGYLGHFTATIKNKYSKIDLIKLTNITVTKIKPGAEAP